MRLAIGFVVVAALAVTFGMLLASVPASTEGAAWNDRGPDGHHALATALARDVPVRALESSLALLPDKTGEGDILFVFAAGRAMSDAEAQRVAAFVERGGTLVVATDTPSMGALSPALGVSLHGLPAMRVDGEGCIHVEVPVGRSQPTACLPSPSALPDETLEDAGVTFTLIARSREPVFFDLSGDGTLSRDDRPPVHAPLVVGWEHGDGNVVAIADADLWLNRVLDEHPGNTALALALVAGADRVLFDSTGSETNQAHLLRSAWLDTLGVEPWNHWPPAALMLAVLIVVAILPRLSPWRAHRFDPEGSDPGVQEEARARLERALGSAGNRTRPPAPAGDWTGKGTGEGAGGVAPSATRNTGSDSPASASGSASPGPRSDAGRVSRVRPGPRDSGTEPSGAHTIPSPTSSSRSRR